MSEEAKTAAEHLAISASYSHFSCSAEEWIVAQVNAQIAIGLLLQELVAQSKAGPAFASPAS